MFRQAFASLIVVCAAAPSWLFLVPGAADTLATYGVVLPFGPPAAQGGQAEEGGSPTGGPGGASGPARMSAVTTTPVVLATINDSLSAVGEGTAIGSVRVVSSAAGTLAEVLVEPGDTVEANDIVARLDSDAEQIEVDRARLALDDARATLERTENLANSSLVATTDLSAAQLAADDAELDLRNAQVALDRRTIRSPIAGTVGLIRVTAGNSVADQSVVTTVEDTSSILVDFWIPERYARSVEPGMDVSISAVAMSGEQFTGRISAIDNRIDPASRTLQVQARIPNEDGALRAGMSLSVVLTFAGEQYPAVNPLAVLWSTEGSHVWKYVDGRATRVMAEIVQRNSDGVLVRAELGPGDAIITEGILQLSEGDEVSLLSGPDGVENLAEAAAVAPLG